jgi:two-component system cell cycle sensor histidine kinase/response regulator CckA
VTRRRPTHHRRQPPLRVPAPEARSVLVVDDEPAVLRLVQRTLEAAGYRVIRTDNGHDALSILGHFRVDLLLTDLVMPGLHGGQVAAQVEQLRDPPRVLLMSAHDLTALRDHGRWPMVTKPFIRSDLLKAVAAALAEHRAHLLER